MRWWGRQKDIIRLKTRHISNSTQHGRNVRKAYNRYMTSGYNENIHPNYVYQGIDDDKSNKLITHNMVEVFIRFICTETGIHRQLIKTVYDWENMSIEISSGEDILSVVEVVIESSHPKIMVSEYTNHI